MAIEKKKMKDPAEAALTAVEQALSLDDRLEVPSPNRPDARAPSEGLTLCSCYMF